MRRADFYDVSITVVAGTLSDGMASALGLGRRHPMSASEIPRTSWIDAARRLQRIGVVLARHGFGEIVARIGVAVPRLPGAAVPEASSERLARRLADVLTELGPTYLKLGQLLATRADLFPPEVVRALSSLHAAVRPVPFRAIVRTLEAELGHPFERAFARFEQHCIGAASIAQVHRATLHDGTDVVVKLQRPSLRVQVDADLAIMLVVARLLEQHVPEVAAYGPVALVEAFASSILRELDFRNEAENARRLGELLRDAAEVRVPRVYEAWTTERMLVLEYVPGTRLVHLPEPARSAARQALLRAFVRQTLEHGLFHADPHPGNLLALPDGRLALLDHGMIAALPEATRARLASLCLALVLRRQDALCEHVIALSNCTGAEHIDRERLKADIAAWLATASRGGGTGILGQLLTMSRVHGLRLPAALLSLVRMLAILDGVLRGLDPSRDVVRDLRREVARAWLRQLARGSRARLRKLPQAVASSARALAGIAVLHVGALIHASRRAAFAGARSVRGQAHALACSARTAPHRLLSSTRPAARRIAAKSGAVLRPTAARQIVPAVARSVRRRLQTATSATMRFGAAVQRGSRRILDWSARAVRRLAQATTRQARRVRALPSRLI